MALEGRKDIDWLVSAFLLLCAVSAYRQISLRYAVHEHLRPAVVYFIYLLLLAGWWSSIRRRVTKGSIRTFLLAEHAVMLLGMTIRYIQDGFLYSDQWLMRISGYWVVVPVIMIPLLGLYAALGLGRSENYRIDRRWYYFMIPAGILIALMLTNESHHVMFRMPDDTQSALHFQSNFGLYLLIAWGFILEVARFFLVYHRSRESEVRLGLRIIPLVIAVAMLAFTIAYVLMSFIVEHELIEFFAVMFFLEVLVWESCILAGMVPVNSHYSEVFDRSTVAMQIIREGGKSYLSSASAPILSAEVLDLLSRQGSYRTAGGQELYLHEIHGGYVVWQTDISQTMAVVAELQSSVEKLEHEGELLRQELKVRSDEASVREQNRIYNLLSDEIREQQHMIIDLLANMSESQDKAAVFRKICLIGTLIKRRCNLRLIALSDGLISGADLDLCFTELFACLREMGVEVSMSRHSVKAMDPELAILSLDVFGALLEAEGFEPASIYLDFHTDIGFTIEVYSSDASQEHVFEPVLDRVRRLLYDVSRQRFDGGYQVHIRSRVA